MSEEIDMIEVKTVLKESQRLPTGNYEYTFDGEKKISQHKRMNYFFTGDPSDPITRRNALSAINVEEYETIIIEGRQLAPNETWRATMELGWKEGWRQGTDEHGDQEMLETRILMQRWQSDRGNTKWEEVKTINE